MLRRILYKCRRCGKITSTTSSSIAREGVCHSCRRRNPMDSFVRDMEMGIRRL